MSEKLEENATQLDGLWVTGGNTFLLRKAFLQSGLDDLLSKLKQKNEFFYGGYSAGICVLSRTLRGIHLVDDPEVQAENYNQEIVWDGLGFFPFSFAPHYKSDHPESSLIEDSIAYFIDHKIPFVALKDGEVFIEES